jgi:hypothetical protein
MYKGKNYEYMDFLNNNKFSKKRMLVILDEDLYINKVDIRSDERSKEEIVSKIIKESFGSGEDFLFNYEVSEDDKKVYICGVRGGHKIAKLCEDARYIKIIPIQIWVINKLKGKIKEKSWKCIFKYMNVYYYCSIIDGFVELAFTQVDLKAFNDKFQGLSKREALYLDNRINGLDLSGIENYNYIELGGILNEKIFSK